MAKGSRLAGRLLEVYSIGTKLRALRMQKGLTLSRLANETGLSTALLSKLETDTMTPNPAYAGDYLPRVWCRPRLLLCRCSEAHIYFVAFCFAHRALCAAAIFFRAAKLILCLLRTGATSFRTSAESRARACWSRAISESMEVRILAIVHVRKYIELVVVAHTRESARMVPECFHECSDSQPAIFLRMRFDRIVPALRVSSA